MTELSRQQKKDEIERLNKELNELKDEEEEPQAETETDDERRDAPASSVNAGARRLSLTEEAPTEAPPKLEKPKRPRTEKQIKQFELVRQRKMAEAEKRKLKRAEDEREQKAQLEKQLIEKAIKLKKKQINRMKIVEDLSEDEDETIPIKKEVRKAPLIKIAPVKAQVVDPYEAFKLKFKII